MKSSLTAAEHGLEDTYWWFVGRRSIIERTLRRYAKPCQAAADVGCGTGRNMVLLGRYAERVVGLDRSMAALGLAAARGFPVSCADGSRLPLADGSLDLATAFDVLEHLDDDMGALAEFNRILRPGGLLLVTVPAYRFLWSGHDEALMHRRRYVASELHMKLNQMGFGVASRSYAVFFAFFPIVFYRLFRGLFPKDALAPKASHVILPSFLNTAFTWMLRIEARLMDVVRLPWGTSIVMLAQKGGAGRPLRSWRGSETAAAHEDSPPEDCLVER